MKGIRITDGYDPVGRGAAVRRFHNSLGVNTTSMRFTRKGWTAHGEWCRMYEYGGRHVWASARTCLKGGSDVMLVTVKCAGFPHPQFTFTDRRPVEEWRTGKAGMPQVCGHYASMYAEAFMMGEDAI